MDRMDEWCIENHQKSGLTEKVLNSVIEIEEAENIIVEFVSKYVIPKTAPLAGNSIHVDKIFIEKQMPKFYNLLHYRIIDVSTIKELCVRWYPQTFEKVPPKKYTHRALDDIRESISELKWYRENIFKKDLN